MAGMLMKWNHGFLWATCYTRKKCTRVTFPRKGIRRRELGYWGRGVELFSMGCTHSSTWETSGGDILNWRHTNIPVSPCKNVDGGIISKFPQRENREFLLPLCLTVSCFVFFYFQDDSKPAVRNWIRCRLHSCSLLIDVSPLNRSCDRVVEHWSPRV